MRYITTSRGVVAIVDDDAFEELSKFSWYACPRGYIRRDVRSGGKKHSASMHRYIMGDPPTGMFVDHINGLKYDNRRENLRFATSSQNQRNRRKPKSKGAKGVVSRYKGVSWRPDRQKWRARISLRSGKNVHIGSFATEKEAALAYNKIALATDPDFYILNEVTF